MTDPFEAKLTELGYTLPPVPAPAGNYVPTRIAGSLLFVSGQIAKRADGHLLTGKLGADLTVEEGQEAARVCALNILAQAKAALGDLSLVRSIVRLNGFVNATPDFTDQPQVINGASDLMCAVLGDKGRHTRAAVGVASLPAGTAVEIDAVIEIEPD